MRKALVATLVLLGAACSDPEVQVGDDDPLRPPSAVPTQTADPEIVTEPDTMVAEPIAPPPPVFPDSSMR